MKKLLLISVSALLLTITGCVTVETSHDTPLMAEFGEVIIVDSYEELDMTTWGDETYKVEAMSTTSGEKFFYRHWAGYYKQAIGSLRNRALNACRDVFNSDCVITRYHLGATGDYVFYTSFENYREREETRLATNREMEETRLVREREQRRLDAEQQRVIEEKRRFNIEQHNIRQAKYQRVEKERIIAELRERCASYGFSGDENIAACIQREAQHDLELEQQRIASNREMEALHRQTQNQLAQQRQSQNIQTQVVEEEIPWILQFLGDVAMGVAEGYAHDAIYHNDKPKVIYRNCDVYKC